MAYYFYVNSRNEAVGPVDDAALAQLARDGSISGKTLVARVGTTTWTVYEKSLILPQSNIPPVPPSLGKQALPAGVKVMAIINLVKSCLLCLCVPFGIYELVTMSLHAEKLARMPYPLWFYYLNICVVFIRIFLSFVSGLGLLLKQEWGRFAAFFYSGSIFLFVPVESVLISIYIIPFILQRASHGGKVVYLTGGYIGGLLAGLLSIAYAALFLYLITRKNCKAALK